jgi:hypothetical protein
MYSKYFHFIYERYCDGFAQGIAGRFLARAPRNSNVEAFSS